jgi:hypothetical protein
MASLTTARQLYSKASKCAEAGDHISAARMVLAAYHNARSSSAKGAEQFAYRMWNAGLGAASAALHNSQNHAMRSEAGRIRRELESKPPVKKAT